MNTEQTITDALARMDALLEPERDLLAIPYSSACVATCRSDMCAIREHITALRERVEELELARDSDYEFDCMRHDRDRLQSEQDVIRTRAEQAEAANVELERLCEATYVAKGADAYNYACELTEQWDADRTEKGLAPIYPAGESRSLCGWIESIRELLEGAEAERSSVISVNHDIAKENASLRTRAEQAEAESASLRRLLFDTYADPVLAYTDDGELQDSTAHPSIDFMRMSPELIRDSIRRREGNGGRLGRLQQQVGELDLHNTKLAHHNGHLFAQIDRLRGLAKWASGRLIDAGDAESAQQVLDLAGQCSADDGAATIAGLRADAERYRIARLP